MRVERYIPLLGLIGLLTGCLTPEDIGYLETSEPVYVTPGAVPVTTPVYNTSPAYYATPVSGYSTMTVYDGYHPGYGGPRYPRHREPPHGGRPVAHGGYGGHGGHTGPRPVTGGQQPARVTQPHSAAQKPLHGKDMSGRGPQWKGGTSGKRGTPGKGSISGKGGVSGKGSISGKDGVSRKGSISGKDGTSRKGNIHGKGNVRKK